MSLYRFDSRGAFLPKFLAFIMLLFIGILVVTYLIARQADPVILDDQGHYRTGGHASGGR
ncbi:MAG: hypothetical protein HZB13_13285 [Acidobacteria bacterium]|nr:hypothetical protein [Acidobacteriota bacterium]